MHGVMASQSTTIGTFQSKPREEAGTIEHAQLRLCFTRTRKQWVTQPEIMCFSFHHCKFHQVKSLFSYLKIEPHVFSITQSQISQIPYLSLDGFLHGGGREGGGDVDDRGVRTRRLPRLKPSFCSEYSG